MGDKVNWSMQNKKENTVQKLTPGEALDWAKGLSHQALNVDYLIGTDGEQYYPSDILKGAVLQDNIAFIADPQRLEIGAYELMQLMEMSFRWGEDGIGAKHFKQKMVVELTALGFEDIQIDKDSVL